MAKIGVEGLAHFPTLSKLAELVAFPPRGIGGGANKDGLSAETLARLGTRIEALLQAGIGAGLDDLATRIAIAEIEVAGKQQVGGIDPGEIEARRRLTALKIDQGYLASISERKLPADLGTAEVSETLFWKGEDLVE